MGEDYYNNIQYIAQGYNIFKGDPIGRVDEGFTGSSVFAFDWTNIVKHGDSKRYPGDITVTSNFGCSSSLTTTTVMTQTELQEEIGKEAEVSLGAGASLGISDVSAKFTASRGFKQAEKLMENGKIGIARATA